MEIIKMERKKSRLRVKLIAVILVVSLCAPVGAQAAMPETVQPMASDYLMDYTAYICAMGDGDLEIGGVDDLGACLGIAPLQIHENFRMFQHPGFRADTVGHTGFSEIGAGGTVQETDTGSDFFVELIFGKHIRSS